MFPFLNEIKENYSGEWNRSDRHPAIQNRLLKLHTFRREGTKLLDTRPVLDAALMGLARHVTLPIEDAVTFKGFLDRKTDQDLNVSF